MICRWTQELLRYLFSVIHWNECMLVDANALTRRFGPLIWIHYRIADILHRRDIDIRPIVYQTSIFHSSTAYKLSASNTALPCAPVIIIPYMTATIASNVLPAIQGYLHPLIPAVHNIADTLKPNEYKGWFICLTHKTISYLLPAVCHFRPVMLWLSHLLLQLRW